MARHGVLVRSLAALRGRCPRCLRGSIYRGQLAMNERCPDCGYAYARPPGDYLGAMYFSYPLAFLVLGAIAVSLELLAPELPWPTIAAISGAGLLPFVPWIFRASRAIWLHFDEYFSALAEDERRHRPR